jgi:hypothetical protein
LPNGRDTITQAYTVFVSGGGSHYVSTILDGDEPISDYIASRTQQFQNLIAANTTNGVLATFTPQGLNPATVDQNLVNQIKAGLSPTLDDATKTVITNGILRSGVQAPTEVNVQQGDKFFRVVPKGQPVGNSSFYLTEAEYKQLIGNSNFEQVLGLPLDSSAAEYDVYATVAKTNTSVFQSTVAPTIQGSYNTTGGAQQTLILDIGKMVGGTAVFSTPEKLRTFVPPQN